MECPKCKSFDVTTQVVTNVELKDKHHGVVWWIFIGWWWVFFKWLFLTIPALIVKIFGHKKQKIVTTEKTVCVCQACGHKWEL